MLRNLVHMLSLFTVVYGARKNLGYLPPTGHTTPAFCAPSTAEVTSTISLFHTLETTLKYTTTTHITSLYIETLTSQIYNTITSTHIQTIVSTQRLVTPAWQTRMITKTVYLPQQTVVSMVNVVTPEQKTSYVDALTTSTASVYKVANTAVYITDLKEVTVPLYSYVTKTQNFTIHQPDKTAVTVETSTLIQSNVIPLAQQTVTRVQTVTEFLNATVYARPAPKTVSKTLTRYIKISKTTTKFTTKTHIVTNTMNLFQFSISTKTLPNVVYSKTIVSESPVLFATATSYKKLETTLTVFNYTEVTSAIPLNTQTITRYREHTFVTTLPAVTVTTIRLEDVTHLENVAVSHMVTSVRNFNPTVTVTVCKKYQYGPNVNSRVYQ